MSPVPIIKSIIWEVIIICLLIITYSYLIGETDVTIKADGKGYYDYLPSAFIHGDLVRKDISRFDNPDFYNRINDYGVYKDFNEYKVSKYLSGPAILISPFFLYNYAYTSLQGLETNGYEKSYHKIVFYAAIFYLFLSLLFFKKLLQLYNVKQTTIILTQLLLVFATSVTYYSYYESSFSHIYSLFAICSFAFFVKSYFIKENPTHFIWACVFLGLIILIRPSNIIIIFFVPFLAGSYKHLKSGIQRIFKHPFKMLTGILLMLAIVFIQSIFWYLQTGNFIVYTYQGEGFRFLSPEIMNILFSYQKGLFIYTPILIITLLGLVRLAYEHKYYAMVMWVAFFFILTYVLSSWWCWYYGASYGLRAYIDFYIVFFILFALFIDKLVLWFKIIIISLSLLTIPLNLVQTFQYKNYILHWSKMDKEKYWKVFLKQDKRYKDMLWKKKINLRYYESVYEMSLGDIDVSPGSDKILFHDTTKNINQFDRVSIIQVMIDNEFYEEETSIMILKIYDPIINKDNLYFFRPLFHCAGNEFNEFQTGLYNIEVPPIKSENEQIITFKISPGDKEVSLRNIRIIFLVQNTK